MIVAFLLTVLILFTINKMLDAIAFIGFGHKGPSYNDLRVKLLGKVKNEVKLHIDSYKNI